MSSLSIKDRHIIYKKIFYSRCKKMSSSSINDHHIIYLCLNYCLPPGSLPKGDGNYMEDQ